MGQIRLKIQPSADTLMHFRSGNSNIADTPAYA